MMTAKKAINRLKEGAPFSGLYVAEWEEELNMAITAMQKEMPDTWIIGREDGRLTYTHDTENCLTTVHIGFPYCPYCGKKMKL